MGKILLPFRDKTSTCSIPTTDRLSRCRSMKSCVPSCTKKVPEVHAIHRQFLFREGADDVVMLSKLRPISQISLFERHAFHPEPLWVALFFSNSQTTE